MIDKREKDSACLCPILMAPAHSITLCNTFLILCGQQISDDHRNVRSKRDRT